MLTERVERELARLPDDLATGAVAGTALVMAERIDAFKGSPSECGKVLLEALAQLRALAPVIEEADGVDDIGDELAKRRERVATAANLSRS